MSTFTLKVPGNPEPFVGLSRADVGNVLARAWGGEWRVVRKDDGTWQMQCRSLNWYPTPVVITGENEEQANVAAMEAIATDPAWALGFEITEVPEVEVTQ